MYLYRCTVHCTVVQRCTVQCTVGLYCVYSDHHHQQSASGARVANTTRDLNVSTLDTDEPGQVLSPCKAGIEDEEHCTEPWSIY